MRSYELEEVDIDDTATMAGEGESQPPVQHAAETSKVAQRIPTGITPTGSGISKGSQAGVSSSKGGTSHVSPAMMGGRHDVTPGTQATGSEKAAQRLTVEGKGKQNASEEFEPMDIEESQHELLAAEELSYLDPVGLNTIWQGQPGEEREEAMRTEIIMRPSIGPHRPLLYVSPQDRAKEACYKDREFTTLTLDQQDLANMRELRRCSLELAAIAKYRYPPLGYDVRDLLTLQAYRKVQVQH